MLDVFDPDSNRAVLADWLELELVVGSHLSVTDALVVRGDQALDDDIDPSGDEFDDETGEFLDASILDGRAEERRDAMWNELSHRQDSLGDLYPFILTAIGANWELKRREGASASDLVAHKAYLTALMMSAFKNLHIKKYPADEEWARLYGEIPAFMQQLATVAAAALMGEAYSFGWPREDSSGFKEAIIDVLSRIGLGKIAAELPADSTGKEKDGTVDVIAWRRFRDGLFGGIIMYGQVASGMNWHEKSVKTFLAEKLLRYMGRRPSEHYVAALFMPYILHNDLAGKRGVSMADAIHDWSQGKEATYGTVVDRLRLAELFGTAFPNPEQVYNCISPNELLTLIEQWNIEVAEYCRH